MQLPSVRPREHLTSESGAPTINPLLLSAELVRFARLLVDSQRLCMATCCWCWLPELSRKGPSACELCSAAPPSCKLPTA